MGHDLVAMFMVSSAIDLDVEPVKDNNQSTDVCHYRSRTKDVIYNVNT